MHCSQFVCVSSTPPLPPVAWLRALQARPAAKQAIPIKPSGRFNREVTQDQLKAMAGEQGANVASMIDMYGYTAADRPGQVGLTDYASSLRSSSAQ